MLLTLQKLTFFSPKLQTLILSCLKSFGFYKLLEIFLSGCFENCYSSSGGGIGFALFRHMLRCPILDWINVNSIAIDCVSVIYWVSNPGAAPRVHRFFPDCALNLFRSSCLEPFPVFLPRGSFASPPVFTPVLGSAVSESSTLPNCRGTFWFRLINFP